MTKLAYLESCEAVVRAQGNVDAEVAKLQLAQQKVTEAQRKVYVQQKNVEEMRRRLAIAKNEQAKAMRKQRAAEQQERFRSQHEAKRKLTFTTPDAKRSKIDEALNTSLDDATLVKFADENLEKQAISQENKEDDAEKRAEAIKDDDTEVDPEMQQENEEEQHGQLNFQDALKCVE